MYCEIDRHGSYCCVHLDRYERRVVGPRNHVHLVPSHLARDHYQSDATVLGWTAEQFAWFDGLEV